MGVKDVIKKVRSEKKYRMGIIIALMIIVGILMLTLKKGTVAFGVILVLLAIALGLEGFEYDADLAKLWETGSYKESRIERIKDSEGNTIELITGSCNRKEFDFNCSDFSTQGEAQAKYDECADIIARNNPSIDVKKLDVFGLDGNKNGIVCEALPSA